MQKAYKKKIVVEREALAYLGSRVLDPGNHKDLI